MPSRRMIDPSIWQSETLASLTYRQRVLFIGLFSNADDQGRVKGHPALIRSMIFPYEDIALTDIQADLDAIEEVESIAQYKVKGKAVIQVLGWWDYQSPQWAYPSDLPPMDGWDDKLRYRKDGQVIDINWKEKGSKSKSSGSSGVKNGGQGDDYTQLGKEIANGLPKSLPKEPAKATGGVIESSSSIVVESDNTTVTTTAHEPAREWNAECGQIAEYLELNGFFLSPGIRDSLLDLYDDISPPKTETRFDWFKYSIDECMKSANRPRWNLVKAVVDGVMDSGSLAAHKANGKPKAKAGHNGARRLVEPKTVSQHLENAPRVAGEF